MNFKHQPGTYDKSWIAVVLSLILSIWVVANDDLINPDGILYLESARLFLEQGLEASYQHYYWPFYPILIALLSQVTSTSLELSAHLVNGFFAGLLTYSYVRCAEELGGKQNVIIAAAVILLLNISLNDYRDLIVRDMGYWACLFTSLWLVLRYKRTNDHRLGLLAGVMLILASLFRIEGIVFLALAPILFLWRSSDLKRDITRILIILCIPFIGVVILLTQTGLVDTLLDGRLGEPLSFMREAQLSLLWSGEASDSVSFSFIMALLLTKSLKATGLLQFCLACWALTSQQIRSQIQNLHFVSGFVFINVAILFIFIAALQFLSTRYAIPLGLLLGLPAAFALAHLFEIPSITNKIKWLRITVIVLLVYHLLDSLISLSGDKSHILKAGNWVQENVSADMRIASNNSYMHYLSGRPVTLSVRDTAIQLNANTKAAQVPKLQPDNYDFVIFSINRKRIGYDELLINWLGKQPVERFENARGDKVLIFRTAK